MRAAVLVAVLPVFARGKQACTDVLAGCCRPGEDCDRIPFMSMMAGLQCLSPTSTQCHEMMVQCVCPVNGEAIDSWETPCEPQPDSVYMYDHITQRCLTCDQYLESLPVEADSSAEPTIVEQTGPYLAGDFPCRLGGPNGDQMEIDCVSIAGASAPGINVGAVSGTPCPYPETTLEGLAEPEPEPEVLPDCGEHGLFTAGSCRCDTEEDPTTGETLKCWQTNRERSNRHPNGNIIEWCSIAMCNFDSSGNAVLASGAQAASTPSKSMSIIADLAKAFGVSPGVVVGAAALITVTACWLMCSGSPSKEQRGRGEPREYEMDEVLPVVEGRPAEMRNPLRSNGGSSAGGQPRGIERGQETAAAARQQHQQHGRSHEQPRQRGMLGYVQSARAQELDAQPAQEAAAAAAQQHEQHGRSREQPRQRGMLGYVQSARAQELYERPA